MVTLTRNRSARRSDAINNMGRTMMQEGCVPMSMISEMGQQGDDDVVVERDDHHQQQLRLTSHAQT